MEIGKVRYACHTRQRASYVWKHSGQHAGAGLNFVDEFAGRMNEVSGKVLFFALRMLDIGAEVCLLDVAVM
jgi:hypothetical protein